MIGPTEPPILSPIGPVWPSKVANLPRAITYSDTNNINANKLKADSPPNRSTLQNIPNVIFLIIVYKVSSSFFNIN